MIDHLVKHPEAIRERLNTDQLDDLIRKLTNTAFGQTVTMRYRVSERRSEVRFDAESEQDLVRSSGIFAKVLTECRIHTFTSCITHTPERGYRVWFTLNLCYRHFDGGTNSMNIATFWFENGKWEMNHFKGEEKNREI